MTVLTQEAGDAGLIRRAGHTPGAAIEILDAWLTAWDRANLAAPY